MSSGYQRIKWRRNIAENFNRLSKVHERYKQTTDGRTTTYSEHEHEFTLDKNWFHLGAIYTCLPTNCLYRIKVVPIFSFQHNE